MLLTNALLCMSLTIPWIFYSQAEIGEGRPSLLCMEEPIMSVSNQYDKGLVTAHFESWTMLVNASAKGQASDWIDVRGITKASIECSGTYQGLNLSVIGSLDNHMPTGEGEGFTIGSWTGLNTGILNFVPYTPVRWLRVVIGDITQDFAQDPISCTIKMHLRSVE